MRMRTIEQAIAYVQATAKRADDHLQILVQQGAASACLAEELRRKRMIEETLRAIQETGADLPVSLRHHGAVVLRAPLITAFS